MELSFLVKTFCGECFCDLEIEFKNAIPEYCYCGNRECENYRVKLIFPKIRAELYNPEKKTS